MTLQPGSVPYLRDNAQRKLRQDWERAKTIRDLAELNFETWPDMDAAEKDVTARQAQKGISELAQMVMHLIRYELGELRPKDD